ncbi:MAG: hypothetical protein OXU81_01455 [Gammaproteobacteria bacterium]|nr:hypothetical protein [Gammaproteobacteria bacterium]
MRALIDGNPEYQAVTVMKVDWDRFSGDPIAGELGVKSRATLVMFSKGEEVGRVMWENGADVIEPLFKAAVS